jgi:hypothetical protein
MMSAANNVAGQTAYEVSSWSSCSADCGWGVQTRNATCRDAAGAIATDCGFAISLSSPCFNNPCRYYSLDWAENMKNDSLTVWKVGDTAKLTWTGGVEDGYVVIRLFHLHGELKSQLYEMNSHLEALDPLLGTDFTGQVIYQGANLYKYDWVVPATVLPSRRYLIELEATNSQFYKLGFASTKIHASVQGLAKFEFKWITSAASATAIKILIEDDYGKTVEVTLDGPHVAGAIQTKLLDVDLGEIREIHSDFAILESVLITSQVTGYVGNFGFSNGTNSYLPSCYSYGDCRLCGESTHCGWCDSRQLCLPLATDAKTWSKIVDCIADPQRPNGYWNANGCIEYINCTSGTDSPNINNPTTGPNPTTGKKNSANTLLYGITLLLALLSILL